MEPRRIFIVGESLFAETLARTLSTVPTVVIVGSAPTPEAALPLLGAHCPDAVIVTGAGENSSAAFGPLLAAFPDLPLVRADVGTRDVRVITSRRVGARSADLLAALTALPKRS